MRRAHHDWPETGIKGALSNFEVRDDGTIAPWLTLDRHLSILDALWRHRPSSIYREVAVPVLMIPAADEASVAEAAAAIPRCRVRAFPGAHHDVHAQHPVEVADAMADALAEGLFP